MVCLSSAIIYAAVFAVSLFVWDTEGTETPQNAILEVITTPSSMRILDFHPHNTFAVFCKIKAMVMGERIPQNEVTIQWIRREGVRKQTCSCSKSCSNVTFTDINDNVITIETAEGFRSILSGNENNPNPSVHYRCRLVYGDATVSSDTLIAVAGSRPPTTPQSVRVIASGKSSVTVQWMMPSVAYTPETYYVDYGTNRSSLEMSCQQRDIDCETYISDDVYSVELDPVNLDHYLPGYGLDISIVNRVFSKELMNLTEYNVYYYCVVANNSAGCSASEVRNVTAIELLNISRNTDDVVLGQEYNLTCTVTNLTERVYNMTWKGSDGQLIADCSSQSSLQLNFKSLNASNAGSYTCTVSFNNGDSTELTEQIVTNDVQLERLDNETLYSGGNFTLRCSMTLFGLSVSFVTPSIHWLKNGEVPQSCSELEREFDTSYYCLLTLTHLSYKSDNGNYSCRGDVTPTPQYPLLRPSSATSDTLDIHVFIPVVNVTMTSSTIRVLDVPPYNQFEGSCSVSVPVGVSGLRGELQWKRRGVEQESFIDVPPSTLNRSSSLTSISYNETTSGIVTYQCEYNLGVDTISNDEIDITVFGMRAPQRPLHLDVVVTEYNAVVNWTVPFITYTPETYVVGYRQNDSSIYHYTETLTGTVDIDAENETYEVELRGLEPATNYCLVVIARNLANFSESEEVCFNTEETAGAVMVSSVNGSAITVSWELLQARGGSIIHYVVWVRSLSDPSDIHIESVPASAPRTLIISKLTCAATYQVYVAAVSKEGVANTSTYGDCKGIGEENETEVTVATLGFDGGGSENRSIVAVGATVSAITLLLIIIVVLIVTVVCIRKRRSLGHKLTITENLRFSALIESIMKGSAQSISWTPHTANTAGTDTELMVVQITPQEDETVDEEEVGESQTTDGAVEEGKEGEGEEREKEEVVDTTEVEAGEKDQEEEGERAHGEQGAAGGTVLASDSVAGGK